MKFQYCLRFLTPFLAFSLWATPANAKYASTRSDKPGEMSVQLSEFKLKISTQILKSGKVHFTIRNHGKETHEFVVSKKENDHFEEIKEIEAFSPDATKEMILSLSPGTYELSCKVIEKEAGETIDHYQKGMHVTFKIVDPLKIGGSGADLGTMKILAQAIQESHPELLVEVFPSLGSGGGIKAVLAGSIDIGLSTRPLKEKEIKKGARTILYAETPFIFATAIDNPQESVRHQDISDIYNQILKIWKNGDRIRLVLRPDSDSDIKILRARFQEINPAPFTGKKWKGVPVAFTDQEAATLLEKTRGSMGTTSLSLLLGENRLLKPLAIDGVLPSPETLQDGTYTMKKTLSFILRSQAEERVKIFLRFVQSEEGKDVLRKTGHRIFDSHFLQ